MDAKKLIRVFISSPDDVAEERRRAALVLGRLKRDFARFFELSPVLWEYEPMLAAGSFQDVILEPAKTDIVVVILWSRLGTPLPARTSMREYRGLDGRAPVTGTEWEFENALGALRERQARDELPTPDILVYKKATEGVARGKTALELTAAAGQMAALEDFWARYFLNPNGQFLLAFNAFKSLNDFERQFEAHLRVLLRDRIERENLRPGAWLGDPFRGLSAFEFEHAGIFFGRSTALQEVTEALARRAEQGSAFVLVTGASGCGKSSLIKAGVVPSLFETGVVLEVPLWRRCVFRLGGEGKIADRLARALIADQALPELIGLGLDADKLAQELRRGEIGSLRFGLIEAARQAPSASGHAEGIGRLVLVIDQLEELFTQPNISAEDREWFVGLIATLASRGFVWVIATLRSDFFAEVASLPILRDLCVGDGLYHLVPPRPEEIDQMIRLPAEAAGIAFEVDPRSGISLDQELREAAASNPHSLPLLEFTLDELYRRDIVARGGKMLRLATYRDELKKLEGAIAARAEAAWQDLPPDARQDAAPSILRSLVTLGDGDKPLARTVARSALTATPERKAALDALVDARLLAVHGQGESAMVGVAHEALITHWPLYAALVSKHARFLRERDRIAQQAKLWHGDRAETSRLLPPGLPLEEGRNLLQRRSELEPIVVQFVEASIGKAERAERRKRRLLITVAVVATFAAAVFAGVAEYARRASVRAESNFEAAAAALSTLIESVPEKVEPVAPLQTVVALLGEANKAIAHFPETEGGTARIKRYRAEISLALSAINYDLGQYLVARDLAGRARAELIEVIAVDPSDFAAHYHLARSEYLIGATFYELKDGDATAVDDYRQAVGELERLVQQRDGDAEAWRWWQMLAQTRQGLGDILLTRLKQPEDAKAQFDLCIQEHETARRLGGAGSAVDHDIGWAVNKLGDVLQQKGDEAGALAFFQQARDRIGALGSHLQENKDWQNHLSLIHNNIGLILNKGRSYQDAITEFKGALELTSELSERDPANADLRSVLGWTYDNMGESWFRWARAERNGDYLGTAREMFAKAHAIRLTLAAMKPLWREDLSYTEANMQAVEGVASELAGNLATAAQRYAEAADRTEAVAKSNNRDETLLRVVELRDWAAQAFGKAGASDQARAQLQAAIELTRSRASVADAAAFSAARAHLEQHLAEIVR